MQRPNQRIMRTTKLVECIFAFITTPNTANHSCHTFVPEAPGGFIEQYENNSQAVYGTVS